MMAISESFKGYQQFCWKDSMIEKEAAKPSSLPYKFNPSFLTDGEVIESFVVRKKELARILGQISANTNAPTNKNVLVSAPRGAGKTTIVRRVLAELRLNHDFSADWFPLILGEESYNITTPGEFFLECLFHLQDQLQDEQWVRAFELAEKQQSEADLLKVSVGELRRFSEHTGKKLLLIVENLHMILGEQIGRDAATLEAVFNAEPSLMLLGTSVKDCADDSQDPDNTKWLYQRFEIVSLQPLDLAECTELWAALTNQEVRSERIRPIQILTGGSPRLMRIMAEFTVSPSLQNLMENLNQLIDQNTEYFKSQLDNLPPTERKVFAALLDIWDPSTAKEVAQNARVNVNIASAMLGRLADRGSVIKLPGKGRAVSYHATERLFNIYYLMRRRSHPSSRVRALVAFMTQYYKNDELVDTTAKLVAEACLLHPHRRQEYHSAFNAIIAQSSGETRQKILSQTPADFLSPLQDDAEFRSALAATERQMDFQKRTVAKKAPRKKRHYEALLSQVKSAINDDKPDVAESLLRDALANDATNGTLWLELAFLLSKESDRRTDAVTAAYNAVDCLPASSTAHSMYGLLLYSEIRDAEKAERHLKQALDLDADNVIALATLGDIRYHNDNLDEALMLYRRAWEVAPDIEESLVKLTSVLGPGLGRAEEAEKLLQQAVAEHPDWDDARQFLAQCLLVLGRAEEAEQTLRLAVEYDPASVDAWFNLAAMLHRTLRKHREAAEAFEKLLGLEPNESFYWQAYAETLSAVDSDFRPALEASGKSIELDPDSVGAWITRAEILAKNEDWLEAEDAYKKAISLPNAGSYPSYEYARFLQQRPGRLDDAEAVLRKSLASTNDAPCMLHKELAALLIHRGQDEEARPFLNGAVDANARCYCSLTLHGGIATRACNAEEAKAFFSRALDVNPKGITAMTSLAQIAIELENDPIAAEHWVEKAVETNPADARVFLARALVKRARGAIVDSIEDLRQSLNITADFPEAQLVLSLILAEHGDPVEAMPFLNEAMAALSNRRELLPGVVDTTIALARRGNAKEALALIEASPAKEFLEPLSVALQMSEGDAPVKAKEVMEVAQDIVARISNVANPKRIE